MRFFAVLVVAAVAAGMVEAVKEDKMRETDSNLPVGDGQRGNPSLQESDDGGKFFFGA